MVVGAALGALALLIGLSVRARQADPAELSDGRTGTSNDGERLASTTTGPWQPPAVLPIPSGMSGRLVVSLLDGRLLLVELANGNLTEIATKGRAGFPHLSVLHAGVVLAGPYEVSALAFDDGRLRKLPDFADGALLRLEAQSTARALFVHRPVSATGSTTIQAWLVDGRGATVAVPSFYLTSGDVAAFSDEGLIVRTGRWSSAVVDASSGAIKATIAGELTAANDRAIVRLLCETETRCRLHSGPYDEPDRHVVDIDPAAPWSLRGARVSPDGRYLLGVDAAEDTAPLIDLHTGETTRLHIARQGGSAIQFSSDGGWLIWAVNAEVHFVNVHTDEHRVTVLGDGTLTDGIFIDAVAVGAST